MSAAVQCRIGCRNDGERVIVRVVGRLTEAHVPDLLEACVKAAGPLLVERDELISADAVGTDALPRLEQRGAQLIARPEYLRLKLEVSTRKRKP